MKRGPTRSQLLRGIGVVLLILAAPLALLYWAADPHGWRRQRDQELRAQFYKHRAAFETLAAMEGNDQVSFGSFWQDDLKQRGVSVARRKQYQKLRAELGNPLLRGGRYGVDFDFSYGGILTIGPDWFEGITYMPVGGSGLAVKSLDDIGMDTYGNFYAPLEGNWYLFFNNYDG